MYELDERDRKILFELDKDSRQSLVSLSKKIGLSKQLIDYRIKKLFKDGIITRFYTELNYGKINTQVFKLHIQLQNFKKEVEEEIYSYFKKQEYSTWVVSCSGKWDMIFAAGAHDAISYNIILTDILNKFSKYIHSKEIITNLYYNVCNRKWLSPKNKSPNITANGGPAVDLHLTENDIKILKVIANNSRESLVTIGLQTNLSPSIVKYRIKRLEKIGVIAAYRIGIDLKAVGKEYCKAFVYLHEKTYEKEMALIEYCKYHPDVIAFIQCIGSWDFEIEFEVDNVDEFHTLMKEIRNKFDFVKSYESVIITREYGDNFMPSTITQLKK